jgi:hypothetical protein
VRNKFEKETRCICRGTKQKDAGEKTGEGNPTKPHKKALATARQHHTNVYSDGNLHSSACPVIA